VLGELKAKDEKAKKPGVRGGWGEVERGRGGGGMEVDGVGRIQDVVTVSRGEDRESFSSKLYLVGATFLLMRSWSGEPICLWRGRQEENEGLFLNRSTGALNENVWGQSSEDLGPEGRVGKLGKRRGKASTTARGGALGNGSREKRKKWDLGHWGEHILLRARTCYLVTRRMTGQTQRGSIKENGPENKGL